MPKIEIDETEYAQRKALSDFVARGLADPRTRRQILEAQKTLDPDRAIPEIDAAKPVMDELAKIREEIAADRKARAEEKAKEDEERTMAPVRAKWAQTQAAAKAAGYNTAEGLKALEDFMTTNGIVDHTIAMPAFERLHPPPQPVATGSQRWGFQLPVADDGRADLDKALKGEISDEGFLNSMLGRAFTEFRSGVGG